MKVLTMKEKGATNKNLHSYFFTHAVYDQESYTKISPKNVFLTLQ